MPDKQQLTTAAGHPIGDNQNSLTAGPHGPILLQDMQLIEKLAHFNRERIPERVVHARGSGAYGTFTVTHDITRYTKAKIFSEIGKETEVFARLATGAGEQGSADTIRDPRGFAVKFYTEEGNWDLTGNGVSPVFAIRDPIKFPDLIHSQRRDPRTNLPSAQTVWDFWSLSPESLHEITILMSERGLPDGYRHLHAFGCHTFSFISPQNERFWVKFHLKTCQGIKNLTVEKAAELAGTDPDYSQRDLFMAIEEGNFPKWKMHVQVMPEMDAENYKFNPFDLTKTWPYSDYPLIEVGILELNRNPDNYFAEVEQAAFSPANVVPGIGFSPDKMLQARLFAYPDAQRYRLGVNYQTLPVNRPRCPVHSYNRDGAMRFDHNGGSTVNYEPNSRSGPTADERFLEPPLKISGDAARYDHREGNNDYEQAGNLFRIMTPTEQKHLTETIAMSLCSVSADVQRRQMGHFYKADPDYGAMVEKELKRILATSEGTTPNADGATILMNAPHIEATPDGTPIPPETSRAPVQQ